MAAIGSIVASFTELSAGFERFVNEKKKSETFRTAMKVIEVSCVVFTAGYFIFSIVPAFVRSAFKFGCRLSFGMLFWDISRIASNCAKTSSDPEGSDSHSLFDDTFLSYICKKCC